jgi:hypothetical protein
MKMVRPLVEPTLFITDLFGHIFISNHYHDHSWEAESRTKWEFGLKIFS